MVSIELAKASLEDFNERYKTLTEQHNTEQDRKAQIDAEVASGEAAIEGDKVKADRKRTGAKPYADASSTNCKTASYN
ncbi:MAG: hypothetical protein QM702_20445 [Rubrivivax sp.]